MSRFSKRSISAALTIGLVGLFAVPGEVRAAEATFTVVDGAGVPVPNAFVAIVKSDGDAVDGSITGADGTAKFDDTGANGYVVTAPGFKPKTGSSLATATITLEASTNSRLATANAYGGQVTSLAADGGSGIAYVTTPEAKPSLWRTTDYGGSWSAVPTLADSTDGIPQAQVSEVFTSGVEGEVAAVVNSALYYSRDYGTTWKTVAGYSSIGGAPQDRDHHWVHAGTSSYLFVNDSTKLYGAVMPQDSSGSAPTLSEITTFGYGANTKVAFAAAKTSNKTYIILANGSAVGIKALTEGATSVASISAGSAVNTGLTINTTSLSGDMLMASTLGTDVVKAVVAYDIESSVGNLKVAHSVDGTTWTQSDSQGSATGSLVGVSSSESLGNNANLDSYNGIGNGVNNQSQCGENGTNPVGSIAPTNPAGALAGFEVVGTIRQCMFAFNTTGGTPVSLTRTGLSAVSVATGKSLVLPMPGANNNTGFVWDSGTNFTDNMVTLTGDGQFGVRKSANISTGTSYRPTFGGAGGTTATVYLNSQAKSGKDTSSGGIAMTGITAPSITDLAYSPNSTDGASYVVSMTATGGSRTLLTTDGGISFSTIGAGGSKAVEWWNGAGGLQHVAAGFAFNANEFLHVKSFNTTSGTGALEMGDELAATAAVRDASDPAARKIFAFNGAANPSGTPLTPGDFVKNSAPGTSPDLIAIEGVPGSNQMYVAVNRCTGNTGPSGCTTDGGTVAVMDLAASSATGAVTLSNVKFYGSELATTGAASVTSVGYTAGITAMQYCPAGSNARVANTLFVAVAGKGIYKIVSGTHSQTGTTTGTFKDLKIDCDTGLMMGVQSDGLYFSFNADTFVKPTLPQAANVQNATSVALQAEGSTGGVTAVIGNEQGDVVALETDVAALGSTPAAVQAGNATNPSVAPTIPPDDAAVINSSSTGKATGRVSDIELPNNATDKVTASSVRKFGASSKMAVGTGSGAFKASLTGVTAPGTGTPGTGAPGTVVTNPGTTTPTVFPKLARGRKATVAVIARRAGIEIPAGAKVKATVGGASKKICRVTGSRITALTPGRCSLSITVTPKSGTPTKRAITLNITGVPTIQRGKALTLLNGAAAVGLTTGKGFKVRGVVASTSKSTCKVIGGRLIGVIAGTCSVTVTVTSPAGVVSSKKLKSVIY